MDRIIAGRCPTKAGRRDGALFCAMSIATISASFTYPPGTTCVLPAGGDEDESPGSDAPIIPRNHGGRGGPAAGPIGLACDR